jgi:hypothetical protein
MGLQQNLELERPFPAAPDHEGYLGAHLINKSLSTLLYCRFPSSSNTLNLA